MKPDLHNPYGYKICYSEKGHKQEQITHFMTHSYRKALEVKLYYIRYPNGKTRTWYILPISKREATAVWNEKPF